MKRSVILVLAISAALGLLAAAQPVAASHSWGGYHWGRTSNPFPLKVGDNVTSAWDSYLNNSAQQWSQSNVLDMNVVAGSAGNVKRCSGPNGRVEVCNAKYGFNGWLGIAGISLSGGHIVKGYVKLNDSYYETATYNTPAWRRFVMCQELGHTIGLDHTDENFNNGNQGTCMDYTNDPDGPPSNESPNAHDYDQLAAIYAHTDSVNTWSLEIADPIGSITPSELVDVNVDAHGNGWITWTYPADAAIR